MRERKMESVAILNFSTGGFIEVLAPSKNGNELDAMKHEAEKTRRRHQECFRG